MKRLVKKAVTVFVTTCLVTGVANIPAYSAVQNISTGKTTEAVLGQPYMKVKVSQAQTQEKEKTTTNTIAANKSKNEVYVVYGANEVAKMNNKYYVGVTINSKKCLVEVSDLDKGKVDAYPVKNLYAQVKEGATPVARINGVYIISQKDAKIMTSDSYSYSSHVRTTTISNGKIDGKIETIDKLHKEGQVCIATVPGKDHRRICVEIPQKYVKDIKSGKISEKDIIVNVNIKETDCVDYIKTDDGRYVIPENKVNFSIQTKQTTTQKIAEKTTEVKTSIDTTIQKAITKLEESKKKLSATAAIIDKTINSLKQSLTGNKTNDSNKKNKENVSVVSKQNKESNNGENKTILLYGGNKEQQAQNQNQTIKASDNSSYKTDKNSKYNKSINIIDGLLKLGSKEIYSPILEKLNKTKTFLNEIVDSGMPSEMVEKYVEEAYAAVSYLVEGNNKVALHPEAVALHMGMRTNAITAKLSNFVESIKNVTVYSNNGYKAISGIAGNLGLEQNVVIEQFIKAGVTKEKLEGVSQTLLEKIKAGETFDNSSTSALAKYLNKDEKLIKVQELVAAIANGSDIKNNLSGFNNSLTLKDQAAVAKLNGDSKTDIYNGYTLDEFMKMMKNGESAIVYESYSNGTSRSLFVTKQNNNSYTITDKAFSANTTKGNIPVVETCTAAQFKQVMSGNSVELPVSLPDMGWSSKMSIKHNAVNSNGKITFISNSGIKEQEIKKLEQQYVDKAEILIDQLKKQDSSNKIKQQWLTAASTIMKVILRGPEAIEEEKTNLMMTFRSIPSTANSILEMIEEGACGGLNTILRGITGEESIAEKEAKLKEALASIQRVADKNGGISAMLQESGNGSIFSSLSNVLKENTVIKNVVYPIFEKYVQPTINKIDSMLKSDNSNDATEAVLNAVKDLTESKLNEIITLANSGKDFSKQQQWLNSALTSIQTIQKNNASVAVLIQETGSGKVFSSLKGTLEKTATYKSYLEYGESGDNLLTKLAKKVNVAKEKVYEIFSSVMKVTKTQLDKVESLVSSLLDKGETFINCAAVSVGAYLNISRNVAAIMNLAADISINADSFVNSNKNGFQGTTTSGEIKSLQKNGHEKAGEVTFDDVDKLMAGLKVGEAAILTVVCYELGGHAVMVKRESNGYGIFDLNRNNGEEVIYTAENFKKMMVGTKDTVVAGKTVDGKAFSSKVYYNAVTTKPKVITDGTSIKMEWISGIYAIKDVDSVQNTNISNTTAAKKETKETKSNTITINKTAKQKAEEAKKQAEEKLKAAQAKAAEAKKKAEEAKKQAEAKIKAAQEKAALAKKQAEEKLKAAQAKAAEVKKKAEEAKKQLEEKLKAAKKGKAA